MEIHHSNNSKNIQIKIKEKDYNIKISYNSNSLNIEVKYKDNNMLLHIYSYEKTMDELKENNPFFKMFENLKEIFEELCEKIEKSSIVEDTDTNTIILIIPVNIGKIEEIKFNLNEIKKNEDRIEELFSLISNLEKKNENKEKEINDLKNEINKINENKEKEKEELKKEIDDLKNEMNTINENKDKEIDDLKNEINQINENKDKEINDLKNEINQINENKEKEELKKEINELKFKVAQLINKNNIKSLLEYNNEKDENEITFNLDSLILKDKDIYNITLKKWIYPYKNIKIQSKLLYRLSRDGNNYEIFHKNCDNKGPTLILIKTKEELIIGGFTLLNWDSNSKWKKDDYTFIFSLTQNKKYIKKEKNSNSIYCLDTYFPMFDNFGFEYKKKINL